MPQYPDLAGQVVLITGGATGIGAGHVEVFAETGAKVAFIDIQDEPGQMLVDRIKAAGGEATYFRCDLTDLDALRSTIDEIGMRIGPIFGLVNNAAVDQRHEFSAFSEADFEWMINVNLRHVLFATQFAVPQMKTLGKGSIVNTSSVTWMRGVVDLPLYATAKAGIVGFTNYLARELGPYRIRVNALLPGFARTPRQETMWKTTAADLEAMRTRQCLPDFVEPRDVANAAVFLCSDAARMITKHSLLINAGSL